MYPLLESHPTHNIAKNLIKISPSIIYFLLDSKRDVAIKMMDSSNVILYATSYGKAHTLFDPYPRETPEGTWIRLAIGYGMELDEVVNELTKMLLNIFATQIKEVSKKDYDSLEELNDEKMFLVYTNNNIVPLKNYKLHKASKVIVYKWNT
jgi:cystathionine beta-lyase/cystathionine gamma-synthase